MSRWNVAIADDNEVGAVAYTPRQNCLGGGTAH